MSDIVIREVVLQCVGQGLAYCERVNLHETQSPLLTVPVPVTIVTILCDTQRKRLHHKEWAWLECTDFDTVTQQPLRPPALAIRGQQLAESMHTVFQWDEYVTRRGAAINWVTDNLAYLPATQRTKIDWYHLWWILLNMTSPLLEVYHPPSPAFIAMLRTELQIQPLVEPVAVTEIRPRRRLQ